MLGRILPALFTFLVLLAALSGAVPGPASHRAAPMHPPVAAGLGAVPSHPSRPAPHSAPAVGIPSAPAHRAPWSGVRSILADVPCNTSGNAEVVNAYDPAVGYLYELWIGCGGIGFSRSVDGGYSFSRAVAVAPSTTGTSWDPALGVSPNGTVYAGFMLNNGTGDAPVVAWSWDHGMTFAGFSFVATPSLNEFSDRDYLAVAPNGTLYVTWDLSPNPSIDVVRCVAGASCYFVAGDFNIVIARSTDGGRHFSSPVAVDPEYPWGGAPAGPLLVEPNGTIDVLYEDYPTSGSNHTLGLGKNYFARSFDGGRTFAPRVAVSSLTFPSSVWWIDGQLARDLGGTLYAAFDAQNGTNDTAYAAVSTNHGASWGPPVRLNPDTNRAAHLLVGVAGGAASTAYLAWMANNSTFGWSAYTATLTGNGSTLSAPTLVSPTFGIPGDWIGDTLGVADLGGGAVDVSFSMGALVSNVSASQVFSAVVGESPPTGAPRITSAVPGAGRVTLGWAPPPSGSGRVDGYFLAWGLLGQKSFYNRSLSKANTSTTIENLPARLGWYFVLSAVNGAGAGPPSPRVNVTLTAWGVLRGSVNPSLARAFLDTASVPVTGGSYLVNTTIGSHQFAVTATDYATFYLAVVLPWNGTVWQNVTLTILPSTVQGFVHPTSASLSVDGASVAVGTGGLFRVTGVAPGAHRFIADLTAFVTVDRNVSVPANTTFWLNLTLFPVNGTLHLTVTPTTASVWVAGRSIVLDARGAANVSEPPGTYPVEVTAIGYDPYFTNVTLAGRMVTSLPVTLNPTSNGGSGPSGVKAPPLPVNLIVGVAVAAVVLAGVGALLLRRRSRSSPRSSVPAADWREADEPFEVPSGEPSDGTGPGEPP